MPSSSSLLFSRRIGASLASRSRRLLSSSSSLSATPHEPLAAGDLLEYSVVYTDRATNFMSAPFGDVYRGISSHLKDTYNASKCVLLPGSGTYGMEAVARQFGNNEHAVVLRNGFFSFRWTQIFDQGGIVDSHTVLCADARKDAVDGKPRLSLRPVDDVVAVIRSEKPALVCMPHVETSVGMVVPHDYIRKVGAATREVGGIFCLDGIASGNVWIDMEDLNIDSYITAPQKGWSAPASCGVVMLGPRAEERLETTTSSSFSVDLKKWGEIMDAFTSGGFAYHTTPPTDSLVSFLGAIEESKAFGLDKLEECTWKLGRRVRGSLEDSGFPSVVTEPELQSPTVVVVHSDAADMAARFKGEGIQIAAGVPWMVGRDSACPTCAGRSSFDCSASCASWEEDIAPHCPSSFRIGLFGLDKMRDVDRAASQFEGALANVAAI